ncbi:MAG: tyrosine-type recombinase/integrase [Atopobiaceae bacterium]|nr:tyrosine-type recombinase/integrase [Atopobiaceae bacterium]
MYEYSSGSLKRGRPSKSFKRGRWRATICYQSDDGDGRGRRQHQISKLLESEVTGAANEGRPKAKKELESWRSDIIEANTRCDGVVSRFTADADEQGMRGWPDQDDVDASAMVPDYVADFIRGLSGTVSPTTQDSYRVSNIYIRNGLGGIHLGDLTMKQVERWRKDLSRHGRKDGGPLSASSVTKSLTLLSETCKHAVKLGDIPSNPCDGVGRPKKKQPDPNALSEDDVARLNSELSKMGLTPLAVGASIALMTGMREGEVCGLRWEDVDLTGRTLQVRKSVGRANGTTYLKEPKSKASRRKLPIGKTLLSVLESRRARMQADCMAAGIPFTGELYVIGYRDGRYLTPHTLGEYWARFAAGNEDREPFVGSKHRVCTFHDLRHTFATRSIASKVDVKTVSSFLGHQDTSITLNVYASSDDDAKRRAADMMDGILGATATEADVMQLRTGTTGE